MNVQGKDLSGAAQVKTVNQVSRDLDLRLKTLAIKFGYPMPVLMGEYVVGLFEQIVERLEGGNPVLITSDVNAEASHFSDTLVIPLPKGKTHDDRDQRDPGTYEVPCNMEPAQEE